MFKDNLLQGKRILVTGGGTGLGKEMATHFAQHGAEIFICGRRNNVLEETAQELKEKFDTTVHYQTLDIRSYQDVDHYIESIFQTGPLDGLVNNAAGNFISPTKDLSPRGFDAIANIVFHGTFYVTHAVGTRLIELQHKASIVSILAYMGMDWLCLCCTISNVKNWFGCYDQIVGSRVGTLWHSSECNCTGTVSNRRCLG